ncbi:nucleotidyltransferase family protein [Metabacillus indicus]|uniref:nucleotidyltransferase family protein n=1 Tax=Metabacillus indicus TaxID=246786 RepID=UPI00068CE56D|nr:nucleotidyltransferase family protein [Metabacillus indicus]
MIIPFIESIYNDSLLRQNDFNYHKLKNDIQHFSIEPQIYALLNRKEYLEDTPAFFVQFLKKGSIAAFIQNLFLKSQMEKILCRFEDQQIETIPLKGVYFSETYFGHLAARSTSDIDLLVRKKDLKKIDGILRLSGFTLESGGPKNHFHCSYFKHLPGSPIPLQVEIHWDILKENTSSFDINTFWESSIPISPHRYIKHLSHQHTFYLMVLHAWRHNLDSLRHFLDILQMTQSLENQLNVADLYRQAKKDGTLKRVQRTLNITRRLFNKCSLTDSYEVNNNYGKWWEYEKIRDRDYRSLKVYLDWVDFVWFGRDRRYQYLKKCTHK